MRERLTCGRSSMINRLGGRGLVGRQRGGMACKRKNKQLLHRTASHLTAKLTLLLPRETQANISSHYTEKSNTVNDINIVHQKKHFNWHLNYGTRHHTRSL